MKEIKIELKEDFDKIIGKIVEYNDELAKKVRYHNGSIEPDNKKEYTEYDEVALSIAADNVVLDILSEQNIKYTSKDSVNSCEVCGCDITVDKTDDIIPEDNKTEDPKDKV